MIDEYSQDRTGWARFSDDREFRYRLGRSLIPTPWDELSKIEGLVRIVWLMLNPSTADAFKLDPTIKKCVKFSLLWGAQAIEVVNLFAYRSPYPHDVARRPVGARGDDWLNDEEILTACMHATKVIGAWGNHGTLDDRHETVRQLLESHEIKIWHLGKTGGEMQPKHPLARGKGFIPLTQPLELLA